MTLRTSYAFAVALPMLAVLPASRMGSAMLAAQTRPASPSYEVYAIRYAGLSAFPVAQLVAGADTARRTDLAMMVWLLKGPGGRNILVDAGFYRPKFVESWKPTDFVKPSDAVAGAGMKPEDISDIIISHIHWDHADGIDLFPKARVWIQKAEYEYYVDSAGGPKHSGIASVNATMLWKLNGLGRVTLVDGDAKEILPGVTVYTGGRHTYASQYAAVATRAGTVVIASDNQYLYENREKHAPIAQTLDAKSNLEAQDRMARIAASVRLIVPGHDPAVFGRFPRVAPRVVRID